MADEQFVRLIKISPAAKELHHVYLGGLLEHTLSVGNLILQVSKNYEGLNLDLLLAGGILHDIGKIHELTYSRSFDYSDSGRLIGHITLGVEMINEKIRLIPDFPQELATNLKHLIISHHGEYHYGSPKRPKILEAFILYYLDDLDAKVEGIKRFIQRGKENQSNWAGYHQVFERYIYKSPDSKDQKDPEDGDNFSSNTYREEG
jgi:3'-5' exoribonuclease